MTIGEFRKSFNVIIDDCRADQGTDYEFSCLFNTAQSLVLSDLIYGENDRTKVSEYSEPKYAFENTQHNVEEILPLVHYYDEDCKPYLFTDDKGRIAFDELRDTFPDEVRYDEDGNISYRGKPEICHVASLARYGSGGKRFVKWFRHNEFQKQCNNPLWEPTDKYPASIYYNDYIQIWPKEKSMVSVSVVRQPVSVSLSMGIDPEMPTKFLNMVLFKMLELKGISNREYQIVQAAQAVE